MEIIFQRRSDEPSLTLQGPPFPLPTPPTNILPHFFHPSYPNRPSLFLLPVPTISTPSLSSSSSSRPSLSCKLLSVGALLQLLPRLRFSSTHLSYRQGALGARESIESLPQLQRHIGPRQIYRRKEGDAPSPKGRRERSYHGWR